MGCEIMLKGKLALALAECCKYNKEKKEIEKKFKKAKGKLKDLKKGEYTNDSGDLLHLTDSSKKTNIDPKELFFKLKKKGLVQAFFLCVKVNITNLKQHMSTSEIDKMQRELEKIKKYSFK